MYMPKYPSITYVMALKVIVIRLAPAERISCVSSAATTSPVTSPTEVKNSCCSGIALQRRSMALIRRMQRLRMLRDSAKNSPAPTRQNTMYINAWAKSASSASGCQRPVSVTTNAASAAPTPAPKSVIKKRINLSRVRFFIMSIRTCFLR